MIFKANWTEHLHLIRKMEMDLVFEYLGGRRFNKGLEVGCGDGYQTTFLSQHCDEFIACDLNFERIKDEFRVSGVSYQRHDADNLKGVFKSEEFDLIFSSNLIEHLSKPEQFIKNTSTFIRKDGYVIHIVPGRVLKTTYILLHFVNLGLLITDRIMGVLRGKKKIIPKISLENNINRVVSGKSGKLFKLLFPQIHGNFPSHGEEFIKFGRKEWQKLFEENGLRVACYIKGPVFSGYGFGFNKMRTFLGGLGLTSEHIFVLQRKG